MKNSEFDERYPAIFQAGGEQHERSAVPPAPASVKPRAVAADEPARRPPVLEPVSRDPKYLPDNRPTTPDSDMSADEPPTVSTMSTVASNPAPWPAWRWLIPVGVALFLLAAGVFCLGAQYWVPASLKIDPSKFHGLNVQPWGLFVYQAAPFLFGGGAGIIGGILFLASRRWAARETILRTAFGLFALAVGVAGWVTNFAMVFFPEASYQRTTDYTGAPQPAPLAYVLMSCGVWLLCLALVMLAVLFVVPRRWRHEWPEAGDGAHQNVPTDRGPSAGRGLVFGVAALALSVFVLFAPYMFPMSTGVQTVQTADGGTYSQQAWAALAQGLLIPLMLAGMIVLSWACIRLAVTPRPVSVQECPTSADADART